MAKANKKSQQASKQEVDKQFAELKGIFLELKEGASVSSMPLLAKNIDLSIDILDAYRRAFMGLKIGDK